MQSRDIAALFNDSQSSASAIANAEDWGMIKATRIKLITSNNLERFHTRGSGCVEKYPGDQPVTGITTKGQTIEHVDKLGMVSEWRHPGMGTLNQRNRLRRRGTL